MQRFLLLLGLLSLGSVIAGCDSNDDDADDALTEGDTITGTLTEDDSVCNASPFERRCDRYTLRMRERGEVMISLSSDDFDTYLYLYRGDDLVENDDDGGSGLNSLITRTLSSGVYEVRASHFGAGEYGAYRLEIDS